MYFMLPDKIVGVAPRVASRSTRAALAGFREYGRTALNLVFDDRPVIIFARDPLDRFRSGFRMLTQTHNVLVNYVGLVDGVLDLGYQNAHVTPQAIYHDAPLAADAPGELRVYPFEEINALWPEVVGVGELRHIGPGEGPKTPQDYDYRRDELEAWLALDYGLRGRMIHDH